MYARKLFINVHVVWNYFFLLVKVMGNSAVFKVETFFELQNVFRMIY